MNTLRLWLRSIHRDLGFFCVGLTVIYAVSGLALNHVGEWDPDFTQYSTEHFISTDWPEGDKEAAAQILAQLDMAGEKHSVYARTEVVRGVEIELSDRLIRLNVAAAECIEEFPAHTGKLAVTHRFDLPLPEDTWLAARETLSRLKLPDAGMKVYDVKIPMRELEITLSNRTLRASNSSDVVVEEGQRPRFFLNTANWLHRNRGKAYWQWFADGYAIGLLVLSFTGIFMLAGRKGLFGRGGLFLVLGIAAPMAYLYYADRLF